MGVAQYVHLVSYLGTAKNLQDRPIVILIQPHISMSFFSSDYLNPPDQKWCCDEFIEIVKVRLGPRSVVRNADAISSEMEFRQERNDGLVALERNGASLLCLLPGCCTDFLVADGTWMVVEGAPGTFHSFLLC